MSKISRIIYSIMNNQVEHSNKDEDMHDEEDEMIQIFFDDFQVISCDANEVTHGLQITKLLYIYIYRRAARYVWTI